MSSDNSAPPTRRRLSEASAVFAKTSDPHLKGGVKPWLVVAALYFDDPIEGDNVWESFLRHLPTRFFRFRAVLKQEGRHVYMVDSEKPIEREYHLREEKSRDWSKARVHTFISSLHSSRMDPSRPGWRCYILNHLQDGATPEGGRHCMILQVDHSIGDGMVLLSALRSLCTDPEAFSLSLPRPRPPEPIGLARRIQYFLEGINYPTLRFFLPPDLPSSVYSRDWRQYTEDMVTWASEEIEMARVKVIREKVPGSSIHVVLLGAMGLAVGEYLKEHGDSTAYQQGLRVAFMRTMRDTTGSSGRDVGEGGHVPDDFFGSRTTSDNFDFIWDDLPCRLAMLFRLSKQNTRSRYSPGPWFQDVSINGLAPWLSPLQLVWLYKFMIRKYTGMFSNIAGPQTQISIANSPMRAIRYYTFIPASLYCGFISYNGKVAVSTTVDSGTVKDPKRLLALFHREFDLLYQEALQPPVPLPPKLRRVPRETLVLLSLPPSLLLLSLFAYLFLRS